MRRLGRYLLLKRPQKGPAHPTDWNVFIYTDSATLPGTQVFSATLRYIPIAQVGTTFKKSVEPGLSPRRSLAAGTYWIEIQANMTLRDAGRMGAGLTARCNLSRAGSRERRRLRGWHHYGQQRPDRPASHYCGLSG